jgi:DNA replicative helicase MCM subunit Mcm2 (Cdc46/Mcm family)
LKTRIVEKLLKRSIKINLILTRVEVRIQFYQKMTPDPKKVHSISEIFEEEIGSLVEFTGTISEVFGVESEGDKRRRNVSLEDKAGDTIIWTLWREEAESFNLENGAIVQVQAIVTKFFHPKNLTGVNWKPPKIVRSISEISEQEIGFLIQFTGTISEVMVVEPNGDETRRHVILKDEAGDKVNWTLWRSKAENFDLQEGTMVQVTARVADFFSPNKNLSGGNYKLAN